MLLEIVKETTANSSTSWVFTTYDVSVSYVADGQPIDDVVDVFEEKPPAFPSKLIEEGYYFVAGVTCDEIANTPGLRYSILGVPENIGRPRRSLRQWLKTRRSTSDDMMEVTRVSDAVIRVLRQLALSSCSSHDVKMLKRHRHLVEPTKPVLPRRLVDDQLVAQIFGRRPDLFLYIGGELGWWLSHRTPENQLGGRLPRRLWSDLIDQVVLTVRKEVDPILARLQAEEEVNSLDSSVLAKNPPCSSSEEVAQQRHEQQLREVASLCNETPEELVARHLLTDEVRRRLY